MRSRHELVSILVRILRHPAILVRTIRQAVGLAVTPGVGTVRPGGPASDGEGDNPLAKELTADFPPLYWFRNSHSFRGDELIAEVFVALGDGGGSIEHVNVTVNDRPASIERKQLRDNHEKAFWYMPRSRCMGATVSCPVSENQPSKRGDSASDYCEIRLEIAGSSQVADWKRTFFAARNFDEFRPTPPVENIQRVSGRGATDYNYWNNGRTDFNRFSALAAEYGIDVESPATRILDWGCGCGRLTRHWLGLYCGKDRVFGADIDPVNLNWCKENLGERNFFLAPLYPPTDLPRPFSLIVGNSVLTHLTHDAMRAWLAHIADLLAPNGLALLSYHGDFSLATYHSRHPDVYRRIKAAGFDATAVSDDLGDAIPDRKYYRQTFMTDEFAEGLFREFFDYRGRRVGVVSRYQNIAILRRMQSGAHESHCTGTSVDGQESGAFSRQATKAQPECVRAADADREPEPASQ